MRLQRLRRRADVLHDALDELVGGKALGKRLVRKHQAMTEHVGHEVGHVFRQRIVPAAQKRERARTFDDMDGGEGVEGGDAELVAFEDAGEDRGRVVL